MDKRIVGKYVLQGAVLTQYRGNEEEVIIPPDSGITGIGDEVFKQCSGIHTAVIPEGIIKLGSRLFAHCVNLTAVTLPRSLSEIGDRALPASGITPFPCAAVFVP
ncbi:MAG: leucine-rich repeat domain-containing protein [Spirochaetaceae bacterium]|jgi:hypothetical protein|nr:leucine-rich repeat domain-containing protein [Spirochaetaceae bacterium]